MNNEIPYDYTKRRNAALFTMDRPTIEAFFASVGQPIDHLSDMTFWAMVCKSVCNIKDAPEGIVYIARRWLYKNGMSAKIKFPYYSKKEAK